MREPGYIDLLSALSHCLSGVFECKSDEIDVYKKYNVSMNGIWFLTRDPDEIAVVRHLTKYRMYPLEDLIGMQYMYCKHNGLREYLIERFGEIPTERFDYRLLSHGVGSMDQRLDNLLDG